MANHWLIQSHKPTLSFNTSINGEPSYWALDVRLDSGTGYQLRCRYDAISETLRMFRWEEGEAVELMRPEIFEERLQAYIENEPYLCESCSKKTVEELEVEVDQSNGRPCLSCVREAKQQARMDLASRQIIKASTTQVEIYDELKRHWDAFVTMFNPAFTL